MKRRICLLVHNVRSLWNVGSFFRTCDAFDVERIILTGYTARPPRKEITKTALGAEKNVPWEHEQDPVGALRKLKNDSWNIIALELAKGAMELSSYVAPSNVCLVVGHELSGIPNDVLELCDGIVKIPMLGKKESLNVAVAAGIALHHLRCFQDASV